MKRGRLNSNCPNLNPLTSNKIDEVYIWAYFNNDELFKSDRVSFNTSAAGVRALRLLQGATKMLQLDKMRFLGVSVKSERIQLKANRWNIEFSEICNKNLATAAEGWRV